MAYIGRDTDKLSNIEVLDTITFDGSSSYTLQKNSVNFTPSSANNVLVSIDGVVQANNFTTSGSTIDFGVAVPSTSTCDWIYHIGVGLITTPADGTVSLAKLSATGTKDSTTFLRGDNTFAEAGGGKVLQYQSAQLTSSLSTTSTSYVDATGLSVSITPASTSNKILILFTGSVGNNGNTENTFVTCLRGTTNLASDVNNYFFFNSAGSRIYAGASLHFIDEPNTTSATTYKIQYRSTGSATGYIQDKARLTLMELSA